MKRLKIIASLFVILFLFTTYGKADVTFTDFTADHWAYEAVTSLHEQKVIQGFPDGSFQPESHVTRAQAAIMIARILQLDGTSPKQIFNDVPITHFANKEVRAVYEQEIVQGYNNLFAPNDKLTRGQMAAIILRAFSDVLPPQDKEVAFTDVAKNHLFYKEISRIAENDITTGYPDNTFKPDHSVTRAEFSTFLERVVQHESKRSASKPIPNIDEDPTIPAKILSVEEEVLRLTNVERKKVGLTPLAMHAKLRNVARLKSEEMRDLQYFNHTSPTYGSPFEMMTTFDIPFRTAAENIAIGYMTPKEVVEAWMNSPGHKKNILSETSTHIGIGYAEGGSEHHYWTQMMASFE